MNERISPVPLQATAQDDHSSQPVSVGLPVRINLRAGISLDELGDQLSDWWSNLTSSVSSALGGSAE